MEKIYSPETIVWGVQEELPEKICMSGNKVFFRGESYEVSRYFIGVREDGPDAYAGFVTVPEGAWCRRIYSYGRSTSKWVRTSKEQRVYIETIGEGVEVLQITRDDKIKWEVGIGYEL